MNHKSRISTILAVVGLLIAGALGVTPGIASADLGHVVVPRPAAP
jgi:hypothetical protein